MLARPGFPLTMALADMAYISYRVRPELVRPLVPGHMALSVVDGHVYVSVVAFSNVALGFAGHPFLPFAFTQINVRTYAIHPETGEMGPFFLRCAVTSRLVGSGARLVGYKWEGLKASLEASTTSRTRRITVDGQLNGPFLIDVEADNDDFGDVRVTSNGVDDTLINLFVGFFPTRRGTGAVSVSHTHFGMREGRALKMVFPCLSKMGILEEAAISCPESVILVERAVFIVYLPSEIVRTG